jgi:hypothetical protein
MYSETSIYTIFYFLQFILFFIILYTLFKKKIIPVIKEESDKFNNELENKEHSLVIYNNKLQILKDELLTKNNEKKETQNKIIHWFQSVENENKKEIEILKKITEINKKNFLIKQKNIIQINKEQKIKSLIKKNFKNFSDSNNVDVVMINNVFDNLKAIKE